MKYEALWIEYEEEKYIPDTGKVRGIFTPVVWTGGAIIPISEAKIGNNLTFYNYKYIGRADITEIIYNLDNTAYVRFKGYNWERL